jgi:phosphate transport system protein
MYTKKEQAIQEIMNSFNEMANLVLAQLNLIEKLMSTKDKAKKKELSDTIKKNEKDIDSFEISISDQFINSIVLYQPLASDIRKLVAVYRMVLNLERIGDLVMNIMGTIKYVESTTEYGSMSELLLNMLASGKIMVEKSLLSFVNSDADFAVWTIKNDPIVDEMNQKLLINNISKANISDKTKEMLISYADLKNIITNIERIADHATNIAEATIYSLQGTDIRHSDLDKESEKNKE